MCKSSCASGTRGGIQPCESPTFSAAHFSSGVHALPKSKLSAMAEVDEFEDSEAKPDADQSTAVSDRKVRSLCLGRSRCLQVAAVCLRTGCAYSLDVLELALRFKKQMVDETSVAAFAQLGSAFFAAARERLALPRDAARQVTGYLLVLFGVDLSGDFICSPLPGACSG